MPDWIKKLILGVFLTGGAGIAGCAGGKAIARRYNQYNKSLQKPLLTTTNNYPKYSCTIGGLIVATVVLYGLM